jgi:hypothetical protein
MQTLPVSKTGKDSVRSRCVDNEVADGKLLTCLVLDEFSAIPHDCFHLPHHMKVLVVLAEW